MAPKKKGKKGKAKGTPIVDGLAPEDMSKEQVVEHIGRIREELDRERVERNYFQLERDRIYTFWEITRRQLEEKKAELRNKDREMEEAEERHQVEIKVYKQKVKHLLYEHQNSLMEMKAEGTVVMKLAQEERRAQEGALCRDMRALQVELKEQELAGELVVKNLRLKHTEEITKIRKDFERQVREIEAKYDKKVRMLRDELDLRRKTEIHEVEERKNGQISMLMQRHEEAFTDIRNYYSEITLNNLALINSLKEQMEAMRKKERHLEKEMMEVSAQNRLLADPLQKARDEMSEMQKQLGGYKRDKQILLCTKARLKVTEEELKSLQWEHEVLEQRFIQVQQERDGLYRKFTAAILEVQQKVGLKNLVLERKVQALATAVEKKEVQFNEVLAASNLDPAALTLVSHKLEDVLESKNSTIKDLQYELARVCKAHNDLLRTYEAKLLAFGVPLDNVGFKPLETAVIGQTLGQGPAGLVGTPT
ncbi:dynein regulatory complex subunit 4 [Globicephala melas]|uniref:dynein regulatory complex subunit 4 n=1 Tax=Globicephala melas TaxID=9731 RepID=UPI00122F6C06|nr:dynein regulatory complex subunit 4 isoform X1 [Globicephala melas]XP_030705260.1 dynein regulatory complex subunit 4 isoform X1 [Globicephala melas]XP_030705261.1 dynein regulatory complex subunit 4 isoform X1 [Globicephala melas]XP_030705262.1 dynein regulatory complex subunit 4 isoform X1 [Globicephala melas]XP_030705263.1 dynein regulatory complex subunit 4 isoform X1 [Globicephala melas]XP_030705264.1 dynein regulatory complex subunit 4 isoform X1 [Globicephala melas]XP_030705265.1 dy